MIRKLRAKFVATAMLSLFIVLTILIGSINIINYQNIVSEADATLSLLQYNEDRFPVKGGKKVNRPCIPAPMERCTPYHLNSLMNPGSSPSL